MSEDDPLANVNLRAVGAMRAPASFADGVLARFASTEAAITVEKRRRARRLAWLAGGAFAVAAALLALVWLWPRGLETGSFAAVEPHHLDVAGLGIDLEGGAAIAWRIDHGDLHVDQRGGATWTVPPGQHLHVEVAGVGAVDASSAILHVEAQMNLMDKKTIGATAATAVLVTAVAATVIHGRATVSGAGQELTIKDGQSASVAPGKGPVEVLTAGEPTALEVVFSGEQRWTDQQLETMENALDHVQLPLGSTVGAVSYATGAQLRAEATASSRFGAGWLGFPTLYRGAKGSDLIQGVTMGFAELAKSKLHHKVLVVIGDGNDTNNSEQAKNALLGLQMHGWNDGTLMHAILLPPFSSTPSLVEQAGIPTVDGTKVDLTQALAEMAGGRVQPPRAVMLVYEGRGTWLTRDVLKAVGDGFESIDMPPSSRIGAIEYSVGASTRVPFEPAERAKAAQLGTAKDYADKRGSDLVQGVTLGLAELAKAPETDKVLIVVGDGHDTNDANAAEALKQLATEAQHHNVRIRAVQVGSIDTLPTDALRLLDPQAASVGGDYRSRILAVTFGISRAVY